MSELGVALVACASIDEARRLAHEAVAGKIAACASIIPWLESHYVWQGKPVVHQETCILFKLPEAGFDRLKSFVQKESSYEVPEILFWKVDASLDRFEEWVLSSCSVHQEHQASVK